MREHSDTRHLTQRYFVASAVAREAGKLALKYFHDSGNLNVRVKGPQDMTSNADSQVEEFIITSLSANFPNDAFLGEEGGGTINNQLWVIDPIDGTTNFIRGLPYFCISLAYLLKDEIEIGIIYDPIADELFAARRGFGATCNGRTMQVSECNDIARAIVGFDFNNRTTMPHLITITERLLKAQCDTRRLGAGALMMAHVADGRFDGYWNKHLYAWDALAALLLVREAGGWTSDFLASDGLTKGNPALVCTQSIKEALIAATGIC